MQFSKKYGIINKSSLKGIEGMINEKSNMQNENNEMKQTFLSNAISDISTYIQLADTKVSIIMGAVVALIAGVIACYEPIGKIINSIKPCSWLGIMFVLFSIICVISILAVFVFGILTIRGHVSKINFESKWFLAKDTKSYSFHEFLIDIKSMSREDVLDNMAAELYKLNDINRQKARTMKWVMRFFSVALIAAFIILILFLISVI